jgi:hypothetical protein
MLTRSENRRIQVEIRIRQPQVTQTYLGDLPPIYLIARGNILTRLKKMQEMGAN